MADIIRNILIGVNPKVSSRTLGIGNNTATYECTTGDDVSSPVAGKIKTINGDEVTIQSSKGNEYTINGCSVIGVATGDPVSLGSPIGKTNSKKITLKSKQDLSSLESTDEKKENSVNKTSDGQIGFNTSEIQGVWDKLVGKPIAISNIPYAPYQATLDQLKKIEALKIESNEIKDNVLSEELKRIKSLF